MAMRAFLVALLISLRGMLAFGQQTRQFTQYMFNQYGHNPAVAGCKECIDFKTGYRKQWLNYENAPNTSFFSITGRIKPKSPLSKGYHGLGFYFEVDETGPISKVFIYPSYAYHLPVNHKVVFSAGIFSGVQQYGFNPGKIKLINPNDQAVNRYSNVWVLPDIAAGVWVYSKRMFMGFAGHQLTGKPINGYGGQIGINSRLARHYNLTGGYTFPYKGDVSFSSSMMLKFIAIAPPALDVTVFAMYKRLIGFGITYRNVDAIATLLRVKVFDYLDIGYSFDYTTSKIRWGSNNSHEIALSFYTCAKKDKNKEKEIKKCDAYD